jgi:hypothetical protein
VQFAHQQAEGDSAVQLQVEDRKRWRLGTVRLRHGGSLPVGGKMSSKIDDGGPAFPRPYGQQDFGNGNSDQQPGMSLRVYAAIHAPAPSESQVRQEETYDRVANPHGDSYKPARRSLLEIDADLRYRWADVMLARQGLKS